MTPSRSGLRAPWAPAHLPAAVGGMVVGGAVLLLAWYGASGEATFADQVPWITVGIVGSVITAASQVSYVMFGRRGVGQRALRLLSVRPAAASFAEPVLAAGSLLAIEGASWYHHAGCVLIDGKRTTVLPSIGDRLPCAVCAR